jgi:hypothetical protein
VSLNPALASWKVLLSVLAPPTNTALLPCACTAKMVGKDLDKFATRTVYLKHITKLSPWPESASDRHLSTNLVKTFAARGVSRSQRGGSPTAVISICRPEPLLFLPSSSSVVLMRLSGPRSRPSTSQKIS